MGNVYYLKQSLNLLWFIILRLLLEFRHFYLDELKLGNIRQLRFKYNLTEIHGLNFHQFSQGENFFLINILVLVSLLSQDFQKFKIQSLIICATFASSLVQEIVKFLILKRYFVICDQHNSFFKIFDHFLKLNVCFLLELENIDLF